MHVPFIDWDSAEMKLSTAAPFAAFELGAKGRDSAFDPGSKYTQILSFWFDCCEDGELERPTMYFDKTLDGDKRYSWKDSRCRFINKSALRFRVIRDALYNSGMIPNKGIEEVDKGALKVSRLLAVASEHNGRHLGRARIPAAKFLELSRFCSHLVSQALCLEPVIKETPLELFRSCGFFHK